MTSGSARITVRRVTEPFTLATPWPRARFALLAFAIIAAVGFTLQILPRPAGWPLGYLFAEDGQVFLTESLRSGGLNLLETYAGYLHLVPRILATSCSTSLDPSWYVQCTGIAAGLIKVIGMAIAWPVLSAYAQSWRWGLAAAASFLLIPTGNLEVLGNLTNLRWYLVVMAFFAVMGIFQSKGLAIGASVIAIAAVLSDPLTLLWLPIAIWRTVSLRGWARMPGVALIVGGVVHIASLEPGARGERGDISDLLSNPFDTVAQLIVRGPVATQNGMLITQEALRFGVLPTIATLLPLVLLIFAAWKYRARFTSTWVFIALLWLAAFVTLFAVLSFPASYIAFTEIWSPSQPSRYSAFAALFLTPAIILLLSVAWRGSAAWWSRATVFLMVGVLLVAFASDFRGDERHSSGETWQTLLDGARQECSTGVGSVDVVNVPEYEGWTTTIPCSWLLTSVR